MRVVVIPTDFSENAYNALACAIQYFEHEETKFILVHGCEIQEEVDQKNVEELFDHLLERVEYLTYNPLHTFEKKVFNAHLILPLKELITIENVDLIVMGTQGKMADRKMSFGGNTLQVIKQVTCPVLAIPLELDFKSPSTILFPTELQAPFVDRELEMLSTIARNNASQVKLLHIATASQLSDQQQDLKNDFLSRFRESEIIYHHQDHIDATTVINNMIATDDVDLLVLTNSKHSFLESYLRVAAIDSLGLHLKIPFLILQNCSR
jgi:nucleotide-binding universal stress UspA family protein